MRLVSLGFSSFYLVDGSWGGGGLGGEVDAGGGLRDALLDVVHCESCGGVGSWWWVCCEMEVRGGARKGHVRLVRFGLRARGCRKNLVSIDAMQSMSCRNVQPGIETRRAGQGCDGFRLLRC